MEYGYSFLRNRVTGRDEVKKPIGEMGMDELKAYLCAKTLGNPKACITCGGFNGCQVGQRALVLMGQENREKAQFRRVWDEQKQAEEKKEVTEDAQVAKIQQTKFGTQSDKDDFRAACESGNARRWLYERGYSEATAQEKLVFWVKHYPDITRQYGKKRILQKLRKVTVTSMEIGTEEQNDPVTAAPQAADLTHTGAAETKVEEMANQRAEATESPEKPQENERKHLWSEEAVESLRGKREAAVRERCMEALASGDPEGFMMSQGITRKGARQNLRRWKERFPDLFLDEKGPEETAPEPDSILVQTEDEISLSDFLRQYGVPILSETPEPVVEPKDEPEENPNRELARLMDQEAKLLEQVADLQGQIWEIRAKRRKIEEKMSH